TRDILLTLIATERRERHREVREHAPLGSRHRGFFFLCLPATTAIYPLSLHDALPISAPPARVQALAPALSRDWVGACRELLRQRSEEHTSELQSLAYLVCRLLLEKKNLRRLLARRSSTSPGSWHRPPVAIAPARSCSR